MSWQTALTVGKVHSIEQKFLKGIPSVKVFETLFLGDATEQEALIQVNFANVKAISSSQPAEYTQPNYESQIAAELEADATSSADEGASCFFF